MTHKPMRIHLFSVRVRCCGMQGVLDMMRYDCCTPASEEDAHKLVRLARGSHDPDDRLVEFRMYSHSGSGPTVARWASFGHEVREFTPII